MKSNINNRRSFLKRCSLATAPLFFPNRQLERTPNLINKPNSISNHEIPVNFIFDGLALSPSQYITKLQEINNLNSIKPDFYGNGGTTRLLEEEFAQLTGKEKAIYLPTGTMANQLAIKLLNGNNTKVIVPENSHVYRDEADAAQGVHNKRLIPVGKGKPHFELADLKETIAYSEENEVFNSGLGTIVIENPVRRADGARVPLETIQEISKYCRDHNYKMHLDGARIHIASAFSNISLAEYASYFDTVYVSLYKYLNASGGAVLCGSASIIDNISHQIKILGGTMYQSWSNTSIASHYLKGIDEKWAKIKSTSEKLISELNKEDGITIKPITNGTNIFELSLANQYDLKKLANHLYDEHNIWLGRANKNAIIKLTFNESLLSRELDLIISSWKSGLKRSSK